MSGEVRNVLSIAGSDPSGGAGIQADLKTFAALGVYGCAVLTSLTAQNTVEVSDVLAVPVDFLNRQLDAVFSDVRIDAVKIGMLGSADAIRTVAAVLRVHQPGFVVLDPVIRATTGAPLLDGGALAVLRDELFPLVTIVTPNADEAGALLNIVTPRTLAEAREAAALLAGCVKSVLVTGGHLAEGEVSVDVLHYGGVLLELQVPRIPSASTHGSGCTLSSAIAALLARGCGLPQACAQAQKFVAAAISRGADLRVGHGNGPVHQLGDLWAVRNLQRNE